MPTPYHYLDYTCLGSDDSSGGGGSGGSGGSGDDTDSNDNPANSNSLVSQSHSIGLKARSRPESNNDYVDPVAEEVTKLSDYVRPSEEATKLGVLMYNNDWDESLIGLVVNSFDDLGLKNKRRRRARSLLEIWIKTCASKTRPSSEYVKVPDFDSSIYRGNALKKMLGSIEGLVCSEEMCDVAKRIIRSQSKAPIPWMEEDLESLAKSGYVLHRLPDDIKEIFYEIVRENIHFNECPSIRGVRRFSNLGKTLKNMEPLKKKRHPATAGLIRNIKEKDHRSILYELYSYVGALPRDIPDNVMDILDVVIDYLPEGGAMDDPEVRRVRHFTRTLLEACKLHNPAEIGSFCDLYMHMPVDNRRPMKDFLEMIEILSHSTDVRRSKKKGEAFSYDVAISEVEMRFGGEKVVGLEYLKNSYDIILNPPVFHDCDDMFRWSLSVPVSEPSSKDIKMCVDDAVRKFAAHVRLLSRSGTGVYQLIDDMNLYKKDVIDRKHLNEDEDNRLGASLARVNDAIITLRKIDQEYKSVIKRGPIPCPSHMQKHLAEAFDGVIVRRVWDLRQLQMLLYLESAAITKYEEFRQRRIDREFIKNIALELYEKDMLESHIQFFAGGCGTAVAEIELYEQLCWLGYDVHFMINDYSPMMRGKALKNCERRGIKADVSSADLRQIDLNDIGKDRQYLVGLQGGTPGNFLNFYEDIARPVGGIFMQRDRILNGKYVQPRYFNTRKRKRDVLLVEGDTVKDVSHYVSDASKLFLAEGLRYGLGMNSLMRDGRLCHTVYFDEHNDLDLKCIYLVTKDTEHFRENDAIMVIESDTMHEDEFDLKMHDAGFNSSFIYGPDNNLVAFCTVDEKLVRPRKWWRRKK